MGVSYLLEIPSGSGTEFQPPVQEVMRSNLGMSSLSVWAVSFQFSYSTLIGHIRIAKRFNLGDYLDISRAIASITLVRREYSLDLQTQPTAILSRT